MKLNPFSKKVTQNHRQTISEGIDFEWSSNSWTHNVFRAFELVFGRAYGKSGVGDTIRIETTAGINDDGRTYQYAHSFESACAIFEGWARGLFPSRIPFKVWVPVMQTPSGFPVPVSPFLFAIAFDAAPAATLTSPFNATCTGANRVLILTGTDASADYSAVTYNSVGLTKDISTGTPDWLQMWHLLAPSTGTNSVAVTGSIGRCQVASYSGVLQSGFPDASASVSRQTNTGAGNNVVSLTVVAANCWVAGSNVDQTINADSGVVITSKRGGETTFGNGRINDSNGTVATGAQSVGYHYTGTNTSTIVALSFAPATATSNASFLLMMC